MVQFVEELLLLPGAKQNPYGDPAFIEQLSQLLFQSSPELLLSGSSLIAIPAFLGRGDDRDFGAGVDEQGGF